VPSARLPFVAVPALLSVLALAACSKPPAAEDHSACRREWVAAYNVIFDTSVSISDVRFMHACMEKRGYKRIYNLGLCKKLDASVREPRCYEKI